MKIIMDDSRITDVGKLKKFLKGSQKLGLTISDGSINEKYAFITKIVRKFKYSWLSSKEKRVVIAYLKRFTGYKKAQV